MQHHHCADKTAFERDRLARDKVLRRGVLQQGDDIVLRLISPLRPGLLQSAERDFWYLIMPIRLAG